MKVAALAVLGLCLMCTLGMGKAVAAGEPAVSQGGSVTAGAGNPAAPRCTPGSLLQALNLSAIDQSVGGRIPGTAALCPLRLHAGFSPPGVTPDSTSCRSQRIGDYICVTCCTCIIISGELDCQCATDCIEVF